jgi:hypothetical protein
MAPAFVPSIDRLNVIAVAAVGVVKLTPSRAVTRTRDRMPLPAGTLASLGPAPRRRWSSGG